MPTDDSASERLQQTFDLFEFGMAMLAARLRREHPDESPAQIERRLDAWLAQADDPARR